MWPMFYKHHHAMANDAPRFTLLPRGACGVISDLKSMNSDISQLDRYTSDTLSSMRFRVKKAYPDKGFRFKYFPIRDKMATALPNTRNAVDPLFNG